MGARDDKSTVPVGNEDSPVFLTATSVIILSVSFMMYDSLLISAGVIYLISPFQNSGLSVFGVLPDTTVQMSPSLYVFISIQHLSFR